MPLSVFLASVFGCEGGDVEPSATDDSTRRRCQWDKECESDEFCHDEVCQRIDDQSFEIELGLLTLPNDHDYSVCDYQVEIAHGTDSCLIRRPAGSNVWDATCEWIPDLDDPVLAIELVGQSTEYAYCSYGIRWDASGVDPVVFLVRVGLVELWSEGQAYGLYVGISPNF